MNWIMLLLALGIYALAFLLFRMHRQWKSTAIKVTGTVTSVRESFRQDPSDDNRTEKTYVPTVKYEGEGRVIEHAFGETSASTTPFKIGQEVEIYFQPGSPDKPLLGSVSMKLAFAWVC